MSTFLGQQFDRQYTIKEAARVEAERKQKQKLDADRLYAETGFRLSELKLHRNPIASIHFPIYVKGCDGMFHYRLNGVHNTEEYVTETALKRDDKIDGHGTIV
jgi:hypothetical protein